MTYHLWGLMWKVRWLDLWLKLRESVWQISCTNMLELGTVAVVVSLER